MRTSNRIFIRNILIFATVTILCFGALAGVLLRGQEAIRASSKWVAHTNFVLHTASEVSALVDDMINAQRGFMISNYALFNNAYKHKKDVLHLRLAELALLIPEKPSQVERLNEMNEAFKQLSQRLEERETVFESNEERAQTFMKSMPWIDALRMKIRHLRDAMITEEQKLLEERITHLEDIKDRYYRAMITGGILSAVIMLLLNGFLLHAQLRRSRAERNLQASEDRFVLAAAGANDGIFDFNAETGEMFCSQAFFGMLGMEQKPGYTTLDEILALIHPDDLPAVKAQGQQFFDGRMDHYSSIFRMRHTNGHWIWINARGKALKDDHGQPVRMVGAHIDITSLKRQQERLQAAYTASENASREKTDFLAHMSHEIRTPLTAISGVAQILEHDTQNFSDKQRRLVRALGSSTASLIDLINDILDFSKIEGGRLVLEARPYMPEDVFEQVVSICSVAGRKKRLDFAFEYGPLMGICLRGDSARLRQILLNLVGNAIKFTEHGHVHVRAQLLDNKQLRIDVSDTGIGIDAHALESVFERFRQGDSSISRKYGGSGLGLSISRQLARHMGGDVSVTSTKGEGATFSLQIPVEVLDCDDCDEGSIEADYTLPRNQTAPKRVLLAEDYEGNTLVVGCLLEDMGITYDVAHTGTQALNLFNEHSYDLILMDIQMPEMDGYSATKKIRTLETQNAARPTPIIGMSAHALGGIREECLDAGMDEYLSKPIVEADLRSLLKAFLS